MAAHSVPTVVGGAGESPVGIISALDIAGALAPPTEERAAVREAGPVRGAAGDRLSSAGTSSASPTAMPRSSRRAVRAGDRRSSCAGATTAG